MKNYIISANGIDELKGVLEVIFSELQINDDPTKTANRILRNSFACGPKIIIFYNPENNNWSWMENVWYDGSRQGKHLSAKIFINSKKPQTLGDIIAEHINKTKNLHFKSNIGENSITIMCHEDIYYIDEVSGNKQTIINSLLEEYGEEEAVVYIDAVNKLYTIHTGSSEYCNILKFASENGFLALVKLMIESGTDVNTDQGYSLIAAVENGHLEVVKYLVNHGADVHSRNNGAIEAAKEYKHLDIVKYLETIKLNKDK